MFHTREKLGEKERNKIHPYGISVLKEKNETVLSLIYTLKNCKSKFLNFTCCISISFNIKLS